MYGYSNSNLATQLVRDHQERLQRHAGRTRLYRET